MNFKMEIRYSFKTMTILISNVSSDSFNRGKSIIVKFKNHKKKWISEINRSKNEFNFE